MIAPQLPTRIPIGQPVFHHDPHRQTNHPMGIVAAWRSNIAPVRREILVARLAMVLRIRQVQFHWTPRPQIAHLMQLSMVHALSSGWLPALGAGAVAFIAIFFDDLGLRQILDPYKGRVRLIFARTRFADWLRVRACNFHPTSLLQLSKCRYSCVG